MGAIGFFRWTDGTARLNPELFSLVEPSPVKGRIWYQGVSYRIVGWDPQRRVLELAPWTHESDEPAQ